LGSIKNVLSPAVKLPSDVKGFTPNTETLDPSELNPGNAATSSA
jgi:hypothetical protein